MELKDPNRKGLKFIFGECDKKGNIQACGMIYEILFDKYYSKPAGKKETITLELKIYLN